MAIVIEVVREVVHGEVVKDHDGKDFEINNHRGNKFWAKPIHCNGPMIMVCSDLDTEKGLIQRRAIVDLLESGVGL